MPQLVSGSEKGIAVLTMRIHVEYVARGMNEQENYHPSSWANNTIWLYVKAKLTLYLTVVDKPD